MNWRASLGNYIFDNVSSNLGYSDVEEDKLTCLI
jgi:hypothetical protein